MRYEIMLIVDPKAEASIGFELIEEVFGKDNVKKAEKLENTDLAYEINKSLKAQYLIFEVLSENKLISEFIRRSNIKKQIWRHLVINLDSERGLGKKAKLSKKAYKNLHSNKENKDVKKTIKPAKNDN
ncbi:30S ribosomal protein S6 [Mycoplasmopsis meleagridis]|uniref:30S ribosomal protein S6 n=1 Tax=Mycoplasmopsis meleagridis TaxID=29561 RepID=UPI003A89B888